MTLSILDWELARYLVNEIQEVYQLQGVKITDKHIEIIVADVEEGTDKRRWRHELPIDEPVER
jgi:hypothetical protein